ncbi:MAG: LEPR-XLL domain-containing protein, partial [Candidatus Accumulibacter sp.]|nr:LEPR-XLL domain-containing protein [Accumulibacter sp.]
MRKPAGRNACLDQSRRLMVQPLLAALRAAFWQPGREPARKSRARARSPVPAKKLAFEALEPRLLLAGDPGAAVLTIAGAIDVPGEQDLYQFTVEEPTRIVFDSLTNRGDLNWRLDGPAGLVSGRSFSATDSLAAASPVGELAPGSYELSVDGQDDALGAYELRVIDTASATAIVPGSPVSGVLDDGKQTAIYRFAARAGDSFFINIEDIEALASGSLSARLLDPFGRQEGSSFAAGNGGERVTVQYSGEYLLLLEGGIANEQALNYAFSVQAIQDSHQPLRLGELTSADIDQAGKIAHFGFDLGASTPLVFDSLTDAGFNWSLAGPAGAHVARRTADGSASFSGRERLVLPPGSYTLSVDLDGAATGSFPFRLLGADSAQPLTVGTSRAGRLDPARGSRLYKVDLAAGDKLFLEARSLSGGALDWRLIDPWGVRVAAASFDPTATDPLPFTAASSGEHWLLLDGADGNAADADVAFEFSLNAVPDLARPLTIGDLVSDEIASAGQATVYGFALSSETQLAFDSQSDRADIVWSLTGPRGSEVSDRRFDASDGAGRLGVLTLPAGNYQLAVHGSGSATGAFAFRLLDLAAAPALSPGTAISTRLSPGNSTQAYRFVAEAGDQISLRSNGGETSWRLIDPYGRELAATPTASTAAANDSETILLATSGAYTLLLEGRVDAATQVDHDFQLDIVGHVTPGGLPDGEALALGSVVAGLLPGADATRTYRFTLAADSQLLIDSQGDASSAVWSLLGPRGTEVANRNLLASDAASANPLLSLPAGDYVLTVKGAAQAGNVFGNGAYAFRLLDVASLPQIAPGQTITTMRLPASATMGYRVDASAGNRLILQAADSAGGVWRLLDPFGRQLAVVSGQAIETGLDIATSGSYTLLNDGYPGANGASNVHFKLGQASRIGAALSFNRPISVSPGGVGSTAEYGFTLDQPGTIIFDALSGPDSRWMLSGAQGTVQGWTSFRDDEARMLRLPAGPYLLILETYSQETSDYRFRVLDANAAIDLASGATINETVAAGETRLYRFSASAGDRGTLKQRDLATGDQKNISWRLWDPYGHPVATSGEGMTATLLPTSGEYLLAVFPHFADRRPDAEPRPLAFTFALSTDRTAPLTLNQRTIGRIERPGEAVRHGFTLTAPTELLVDTGDANGDFSWTLSGPRGDEIPLHDPGSTIAPTSFASPRASLLSLPAGNYHFTVASTTLAIGDFTFMLRDAGTLPALPLETLNALTLNPASQAQAYQLVVDQDSEFLFTPTATSVRDADWRILDSVGATRVGGTMSESTELFALPAGRYTFVLDSRQVDSSSDSYEFLLRQMRVRTEALTLDSQAHEISGSIEQPGQIRDYSFSTDSPTTLVLDALSARDDLAWQLAGPGGLVHSEDHLGGPGSITPLQLDTPGRYRLRIIPYFGATGEFRFRLIDARYAAPLPLDSERTLLLDSGSSVRVFQIEAEAGDHFRFDVKSLSGGVASAQVSAPGDPVPLLSASVAPGSPFVKRLATGGRQLFIVAGSGASDAPLTLGYSASLARPRVSSVGIGSEARGSTRIAGLADQWRFSLLQPTRLLFDGLAGSGNHWTLWAADGASVASGACDGNKLLSLVPGAFRLEVQADQVADLGPYAFRLLDFALAGTLSSNQDSSGSLAGNTAASIFRILPARNGQALSIDAIASNGESGTVTVHDADGMLLGEYALPVLGLADVPGVDGSERLLVVDGFAAAAKPLRYTLSARQSQPPRVLPGETLTGTLARAGDRISYRVVVPFGQDLPAQAWVHDAGGDDSNIRWRLLPAGDDAEIADWWPDARDAGNADAYDWLVSAGDYDLSIEANADDAAFTLQLLTGDTAISIPATGLHQKMAHGRDALVYEYNVGEVGDTHVWNTHHLQLETADASLLQWTLYDADGWQIVGSDSGGTFELDDLAAGRHLLVVAGRAEANESVEFDLTLSPATVVPGERISGHLSDTEPIRSYVLRVPAAGHFQVHDGGSDAGVKWRLHPLAAAAESSDWISLGAVPARAPHPEGSYPFLDDLRGGSYVFEVSADTEDAAFVFHVVDLDRAPSLFSGETAVEFAAGEQIKVFRLDPSPAGRFLQLALDGGDEDEEEIVWLLFDADQRLISQGSGTSASIRTPVDNAPYTVELMRRAALAETSSLSVRLSLTSGPPPTVQLDEVTTVSLDASNAYEVTFALVVTDGSRLLVDALSDVRNVDYEILSANGRRLANHYLGNRNVSLLDLEPGRYTMRLYANSTPETEASTVDFSFQLLDVLRDHREILTTAMPLNGTFAPGSEQTQVYRLHARAGDTLSIAVSTATGFQERAYEASQTLFDPFGRVVATTWLGSGPLQRTLDESGTYTLVVSGGQGSVGSLDYSISASLLAREERLQIPSTLLTPGVDIRDVLAGAGKAYRFTLTEPGLLVLSGRTSGGSSPWWAHWVVRDAAGFLSGDHGYWNGFDDSVAPLALAAGDYTIEVSEYYGEGGSFAFRVDGSTAASPAVPGSRFGDSGAALYKVDLVAGSEYLLHTPGSAEWTIHRPDFSLAQRLAGSDLLRFVPALDGTWYFARGWDLSGDSTLLLEHAGNPIIIGASVAGQLTAHGTGDLYQLSLAEDKRLLLNFTQLDAPVRVLLYQGNDLYRTIDAHSALSFPITTLQLAAGAYRIEIHPGQGATGNEAYAFRLLDFADAQALTPNATAAGSLQAGESVIYSLDLAAGTLLDYLPVTVDAFDGQWQLFDRDAAAIASGSLTEQASLSPVSATGRHFLVWDSKPGHSAGGGQRPYRFGLKAAQTITPGERVDGLAFAGGTLATYRLTLSTATRLLIDRVKNASDDADFAWWISRDDQLLVQGDLYGASTLADQLPIVELPAGSYLLEFEASDEQTQADDFAFRLLDLAQSQAVQIGARTSGERPAGEAATFNFVGQAGDELTIRQYLGDNDRWWLLDEFGRETANGEGSGWSGFLPRSGTYFVLRDDGGGAAADGSLRVYDFGLSTTATRTPAPTEMPSIAVDSVVDGMLDDHGSRSYRFTTNSAGALWLAPLTPDFAAHVEVRSASGWRIHAADYFDATHQTIQLPAADSYTLELRDVYGRQNARSLRFALRDLSAAVPLQAGSQGSGSVRHAGDVQAYRFTVSDGEGVVVAGDPASANGLSWRLISPFGDKLAEGDVRYTSTLQALAAGDYLLLIDGGIDERAASYAFTLRKPSARQATALPLNSLLKPTLAAGGEARYTLRLEQPGVVAFDSLTADVGLHWQLAGPAGKLLFSRAMLASAGGDFAGYLAAGDYMLLIANPGNAEASGAFRVLDPAGAKPLAVEATQTTSTTPANGMQLFRFDALAGDRYFLDALVTDGDTSRSATSRAVPYWQLLDPLGREVVANTPMGTASATPAYSDPQTGQVLYRHGFRGIDKETASLQLSGTYTLVVSGLAPADSTPAHAAFRLFRLPAQPPIAIDAFASAGSPDLTLTGLTVNPAGSIQTGQTIDIEWLIENAGVQSTASSWNDRVIVRNLDTGRIVADVLVPYDAATRGNGPIAPGDSRHRSQTLFLPDGSDAAGRLQVMVIADADNVVRERGAGGDRERNNALSIDIDAVRAAHSELHIENLAFDPTAAFEPGASVTVNWETANRGTQAAVPGWSEHLELRNLTTGALLATVAVPDPASTTPLAVGATRSQSARLVWPGGVNAAGRFALRVVISGQDGNIAQHAELIHEVGADLQIRNLRVDGADIHAGGMVSIRWQEWNEGGSSTATAFNERIVVSRPDAVLPLLDTSLAYDPLAETAGRGNGPIGPGEHRERSFSFRLPEGIRGTGNIEISITADQDNNGFGMLFETDSGKPGRDAESNNSASLQLRSAPVAYADLQVEAFAAPTSGIAGDMISIDWRVANRGAADSEADWSDQLVISRDAVIGNSDDVVVGSFRHVGGLRSGESYTQSVTAALPFAGQGRFVLGVRADAGQEVIEPDTRADNIAGTAIELQTPAADLTISSIVLPTVASSAETIRVSWSVRNDGKARSDLALWNDRLMLSTDANFDAGDSVVASLPHAGTLAPGESYLAETMLTLPRLESGAFFLIVDADAGRRVSENGSTANNRAASATPLRIEQTPTADLAVGEVVGPTIMRPGESGSISYTMRNLGNAPAAYRWRERIFLDQGSAGLREVANVADPAPLAAGAIVARSVNFTLSAATAAGEFRWLVVIDSEEASDELLVDNNRAASTETLRVVRSDLGISTVDYPSRVESGSKLHLEWTVLNSAASTSGSWSDRVFLTHNDQQHQVAEIKHSGPLDTGASYVARADFDVPVDFVGDYELIIVSDANAAIADRDRDNNRFAAPLTIELVPYVDLVIDGLTLAPEGPLQPGETVTANWLTSNRGSRTLDEPWSERLELLDSDSNRVVATLELLNDAPLAAGASRANSARFAWPSGAAAAGRFSLRVSTDAGAQIDEANPDGSAEANNSAALQRISGPDLLVRELHVLAADAPQIHAGGLLNISWETWNEGSSASDASFDERISARSIADDVIIADALLHFDPLATVDGMPGSALRPGEHRQRSFSLLLPEGIKGSGDIELTVTTDQGQGGVGVIFETNANGDAESNNSASVLFASAARAYPDLRIENANAPQTAVGGEFAEISWTVANRGQVEASGVWSDQVVLSTDPLIGNGDDQVLGDFQHAGELQPGESYTQNVALRLPIRDTKTCYLGVRADSGDAVEPDPEADNFSAAMAIDLITPIVDLTVTALTTPTSARSGDTLS